MKICSVAILLIVMNSQTSFAGEFTLSQEEQDLYNEYYNHSQLRLSVWKLLSAENQELLQLAGDDFFKNKKEIKAILTHFITQYYKKGIESGEINKNQENEVPRIVDIIMRMKETMQSNQKIKISCEIDARIKAYQDLRKNQNLYQRILKNNFFLDEAKSREAVYTWATTAVDYMLTAQLIDPKLKKQKIEELVNKKWKELNSAYTKKPKFCSNNQGCMH